MGERWRALDGVRRAFPPAAMAHEAAEAAAAAAARVGGGGGTLGAPPFAFDPDGRDASDDDELLTSSGARTGSVSASADSAALSSNCPLAAAPACCWRATPAGAGVAGGGAPARAGAVPGARRGSALAPGGRGRSPEEALGAVTEARRAAPAVLFLPHLRLWGQRLADAARDAARAHGGRARRPAAAAARHLRLRGGGAGRGAGRRVRRRAGDAAGGAVRGARPSSAPRGGGARRARRRRARGPRASTKAAAWTTPSRCWRARRRRAGSAAAPAAAAARAGQRGDRGYARRGGPRAAAAAHVPSRPRHDLAVQEAGATSTPGVGGGGAGARGARATPWTCPRPVARQRLVPPWTFLRDARLIVTAAKAYWGGFGESAAERSAHAATREAAARRAADPEGRQLVSPRTRWTTPCAMAGALDPGLGPVRDHRAARAGATRTRAGRRGAPSSASARGRGRRRGDAADAGRASRATGARAAAATSARRRGGRRGGGRR